MARRKKPPTLGQQIKAARIDAGLTQTELGEELALSQPFIAKIEGGQSRPNIHHLLAISAATGCRFVIDHGEISVVQ